MPWTRDVVELIARVAHEANRGYCQSIDDLSQPSWDEAPEWQKQSAINGVKFHLEGRGDSPAASHENWMKEKLDAGWKYGPVKDPAKKEHPCMLPYEQLPLSQRSKDFIFASIVKAFRDVDGSIYSRLARSA